MRLLATNQRDQNQAILDPWSVVHLGSGVASGMIGVPFVWAVAGAVAYELLEQIAEREGWGQRLFQTSGPESFANAVADVAIFAAGHKIAEAYKR